MVDPEVRAGLLAIKELRVRASTGIRDQRSRLAELESPAGPHEEGRPTGRGERADDLRLRPGHPSFGACEVVQPLPLKEGQHPEVRGPGVRARDHDTVVPACDHVAAGRNLIEFLLRHGADLQRSLAAKDDHPFAVPGIRQLQSRQGHSVELIQSALKRIEPTLVRPGLGDCENPFERRDIDWFGSGSRLRAQATYERRYQCRADQYRG